MGVQVGPPILLGGAGRMYRQRVQPREARAGGADDSANGAKRGARPPPTLRPASPSSWKEAKPNAADPGRLGSAVPHRCRSWLVVNACSRTACHFLQAETSRSSSQPARCSYGAERDLDRPSRDRGGPSPKKTLASCSTYYPQMGVFITRGMGVGIPAGGLVIGTGPDGKNSASIHIQVALDMCPYWLEIAVEHLRVPHPPEPRFWPRKRLERKRQWARRWAVRRASKRAAN